MRDQRGGYGVGTPDPLNGFELQQIPVVMDAVYLVQGPKASSFLRATLIIGYHKPRYSHRNEGGSTGYPDKAVTCWQR